LVGQPYGTEAAAQRQDDPRDLSLQWGQIGKGAYQVGFEVVNLADMVDLDFAEVLLQ
jgi:hypothetical protein